MPKVWIDATSIRGRLSGIGYYSLNLIDALYGLQGSEDFELGVYCHPSFKNWLIRQREPRDRLQPYAPIATLPLPVTIADRLAQISPQFLPPAARFSNDPALLHGTDHYVYPCPTARQVMTIHDLTFIKYPQYATQVVRTYRGRIQRCLAWTDAIITFAESTKADIVNYFQVDPAKIFLTPQASRYPGDPDWLETLEPIKSAIAYDFERPYLLFVGTLEPRKNVGGLIAAFNYLKQTEKIPHQLVLIGQKGWKYEGIERSISQSPHRDDIHLLDYLSDRAVAYFYRHAEAFVYPSFYEGFGLPVLEAMTLGVPVVTANISSLPEVAGDAAILVDPHDLHSIAEGIARVLQSPRDRQALIERGKQRSRQFSWQKTAQLTLRAYRHLLDRP